MYFNKIDHPLNFAPGEAPEIERLEANIFRLTRPDGRWIDGSARLGIERRLEHGAAAAGEAFGCSIGAGGRITLSGPGGAVLLQSHPHMPFGVCGNKWLFSFARSPGMRFFGMGEKNIGFEKTGMRSKFWNTDVWADFHMDQVANGSTDPMYASFPTLLIRQEGYWIGILVASLYPVFMDTGAKQVIEGVKDPGGAGSFFYFGSTDGMPDVYVTASADARDVIRSIARLSGLPERPPLWALGYQQSRWGYRSLDDIEGLDREFRRRELPCDGLWLDIDYMDGYRVFTVAEQGFDDCGARIRRLNEAGRKVVPILDPGVKQDPAFPVMREGLEKGIFCQNRQGLPYVGFVWPGASLFPDFSLEACKEWWAQRTAELCAYGFNAFWVDMNDPSTGSSALEEMLFGRGTLPHEAFHNGYGRAMSEATRDGLRLAYPDKRPFVLSRSGSIGSSRSCALWCGDNVSNYHHLRKGVEMMLSLSISGMAYAGNDLGGFGGDCGEELFVDWHRANLLFPVYRNHSAAGTRPQEPWRFSRRALDAVRRAIVTRYAFLPYLYNAMIELAKNGTPVIRPLLWEDSRPEHWAAADEFLVGDALFQAPKLHEGQKARDLHLPEGEWISLSTGLEYDGARPSRVSFRKDPLALFLRAGSLVPIAALRGPVRHSGDIDLADITLLVYAGAANGDGRERELALAYSFDSGDGWDYVSEPSAAEPGSPRSSGIMTVSGLRSVAGIALNVRSSARLRFRIGVLGAPRGLRVNGTVLNLRRGRLQIPGLGAPVWLSGAVELPGEPPL